MGLQAQRAGHLPLLAVLLCYGCVVLALLFIAHGHDEVVTAPDDRADAVEEGEEGVVLLLCDGVAKEDIYDTLETEEGQAQAFAKLPKATRRPRR